MLAADDMDLFIVDDDLIHDEFQIGLAEWNIAGGDILAYHRAKLLDHGRNTSLKR